MAEARTNTAIRFPPELHAELTRAAEERGLSVNRIVVEAVKDFLPRLIPVDEWTLVKTNGHEAAAP